MNDDVLSSASLRAVQTLLMDRWRSMRLARGQMKFQWLASGFAKKRMFFRYPSIIFSLFLFTHISKKYFFAFPEYSCVTSTYR